MGRAMDLMKPATIPTGEPMKEFAFDVTLYAALRVTALNEAGARKKLADHLDATDAALGAWSDGQPILAEVSLGSVDLFEIDGEAV